MDLCLVAGHRGIELGQLLRVGLLLRLGLVARHDLFLLHANAAWRWRVALDG
jgi:hypothetical protein